MTKQSKKFSPFGSQFGAMDEWQENWEKMASKSQKEMLKNMKKMGIPFEAEMKKMASQSQKAMRKNMKKMGIPFEAEMKKEAVEDYWQDIWKKMASQSQKAMHKNMKNMGFPSEPGIGNAVFNPEVMTKTFTEAIQKMAKKPEKFAGLYEQHLKDFQELLQSTMDRVQGKITKILAEPTEGDKRFQDSEWSDNPFFSLLKESYLLNANFLKKVVNSIEGLDPITSRKVMFYTSQVIDALSPTNFPLTNPAVLQETFTTSGKNLVRGFQKYLEDAKSGQWHNRVTDMKAFEVGKDLATTPGKVVFQNELFQLIQYESLTKRVSKRPLLIIPPWINKYYIFDLKPENSFVRWAVESGLTVFVISWVNPDERHAHKTLTDYTLQGVKTAIDQVCKITNEDKVNALGFCNGGTLLSLLMAYLSKKKSNPIASATILASTYDFNKADELGIYRCEHQQRKLEEHVQKKGYLESQYMIQAFSLLRANDLIWSSYINNYLLGREPFPFDMLYWNSDGLRMPAKMHMTYLRDVVIENRLVTPGSLFIEDVPIDLRKILTPLYILATYSDHIAPWRSVYPITQMAKSPSKKFVLGASGHVAGIINHPSRQKYNYWTSESLPMDADEWLKTAQKHEGSWWDDWRQWLDTYGEGTVPARSLQKEYVIEPAPGSYALKVAD
jgi:polyhydroxyalkanoate synthase